MESLGERLRRFREAVGLTQADVTKSLGLGKVALTQYERDKLNPGEDVLRRLAGLYGTHSAVLRYGEQVLAGISAELVVREVRKAAQDLNRFADRFEDYAGMLEGAENLSVTPTDADSDGEPEEPLEDQAVE